MKVNLPIITRKNCHNQVIKSISDNARFEKAKNFLTCKHKVLS